MEKVLILGNGFNSNMGFKIDYKDYFNSNYWTQLRIDSECLSPSPLFSFLRNKVCSHEYNIECIFQEYVCSIADISCAEADKMFLLCLEKSFSAFVDANTNEYDKESIAYDTLVEFQQLRNNATDGSFPIYSFCYTLFDKIREDLQPTLYEDIENVNRGEPYGNPLGGTKIIIDYIHGRAADGKSSAIFGISKDMMSAETPEICEAYSFLVKEQHPGYMQEKKKYLLDSLTKADEITFFGFGFTEPDIPYLKDWLTSTLNTPKRKKIKIHTLRTECKNISDRIKTIAGSNWDSFIKQYKIMFIDEKGICIKL